MGEPPGVSSISGRREPSLFSGLPVSEPAMEAHVSVHSGAEKPLVASGCVRAGVFSRIHEQVSQKGDSFPNIVIFSPQLENVCI